MVLPCGILNFYFAEFTRKALNSETNKWISVKFGFRNYSENYLLNLVLVCVKTTHLPCLKFLFQSLQLWCYLRYFYLLRNPCSIAVSLTSSHKTLF